MKTRFGLLLVVSAALASSGCKMCCPSYDYCSPTNPGASQSEWCGKERRGSIFYGGSPEGTVTGDTIMESPDSSAPQVPQPAPAPPQAAPSPMKATGYSRTVAQPNSSARRTR